MCADDTTVADLSIIFDGDVFRMNSVKDDIIPDVDLFSYVYAPHTVQLNPDRRNRETGSNPLKNPVL